MDEYSRRKAGSGLVISRKGPGSSLKDPAETRERNTQVCSRAGCSSKMNTVKGNQIGSASKAKTSKHFFHSSSNGKEVIGSSSRTPVSVHSPRKSCSDRCKKSSSQTVETDSETGSLQAESEVLVPLSSPSKTQRDHPEPDNEQAEDTVTELGSSSSSSSSSSGPLKRTTQRSPVRSSSSLALKHGNQGARNGASTSRYNLRSFRCNSISDVISSGCSSSESSLNRRDIGRKRIGEPESSLSSRGKKISGHLQDDKRNDNSNRGTGISISESRRSRNWTHGLDNDVSSVRNRRSTIRARLSDQENRNRLPVTDSSISNPTVPQPDVSLDAPIENQLSVDAPSNRISSYSRPGSSSENTRANRATVPYEAGVARSFMNRDSLRQYNLDGIAQMLLALERIEHDEELTYEQLLVLETNLFLGGLGIHDQHRDMRLDIDNMSYEELLALEERMGTVSTALSEEALAKCLSKSIYQSSDVDAGICDSREDGDDVKCSICQEEYEDGEEVGRLGCDHRYHVECINQWLHLKNWCPICKASAAPPPSPPPSASPLPSP